MRLRLATKGFLPLMLFMLAAGCETTGVSKQLDATIIDTHRRIVKLDNDLGSAIDKLNVTTAELIARVDESDQQTRALRTIVEENQVKLDSLSRELTGLKVTLYRHFNLTPPSIIGPPPLTGMDPMIEGERESVVIEPPPSLDTPPPTVAPPVTPGFPPVTVPSGRTAEMLYGDPKVFYQKAQKNFANEDYSLALQQFDDYLRRYPDTELSPNAQFWKATCYLNLEQYLEAVEEFNVLLRQYPESTKAPFALRNLAKAYEQLGQTEKAKQMLTQLIDQYPISPAADGARRDFERLAEP